MSTPELQIPNIVSQKAAVTSSISTLLCSNLRMAPWVSPLEFKLTWCQFAIFICLYNPFLIFHLRRFSAQQWNIIYAMRYCKITILQCYIFIVKLCMYTIWNITWIYGLYDYHSTANNTFWIIEAALTSLFLFCFLWKFHLLRYNIMLHSAVMGSEWKAVINSTTYCQRNSFYIKFRGSLGSYKWTMCLFAVISLIAISIDVAAYFIWGGYGTDFYNLIPFLPLIILYICTPAFDDNFFIRQEMKYIVICLVASYISFYSWDLLSARFDPNYDNLSTGPIIYFVTNQLWNLGQFIAMLISTFWVNRRCEHIIEFQRYQIHEIKRKSVYDELHTLEIVPNLKTVEEQIMRNESNDHKSSPTSPSPLASSKLVNNDDTLSLQSILADDRLLDLFANHLVRDYSIECLLSLIEMQQFKCHIKEQLNVNGGTEMLELAAKAPRSEVVHKEITLTPDLNTLKGIAHTLFEKYVKEGSEFEINIPSRLRQRLQVQMGDRDAWMANNMNGDELESIFDHAMEEILILLNQSSHRFHDNLIRMSTN